MQYTYNIVEAAALWADVDFSIVRERMDSADMAEIEAEYEQDKRVAFVEDFEDEDAWRQQRKACAQCELEAQCPEGVVAVCFRDGDEVHILQCPQGFIRKPADEVPAPRVVKRREWKQRLLPRPGEFDDLPGFEQRLGWLQTALNLGDLGGTPEVVRANDLRAWLQQHFPGQQPEFLFPSEDLHPLTEGVSGKAEHHASERAGERSGSGTVVNKLKNKKPDLLAPVIEGLVDELSSDEPSVIFPALFDMALDKRPPLSWAEGKFIIWNDANGDSQKLTYDALAGRLRRRRNS